MSLLKPGDRMAGCTVVSLLGNGDVSLRCPGKKGPCDSTFLASSVLVIKTHYSMKSLYCPACRSEVDVQTHEACSDCCERHGPLKEIPIPVQVPENENARNGVRLLRQGCSVSHVTQECNVSSQTVFMWRVKWVTISMLLDRVRELQTELERLKNPESSTLNDARGPIPPPDGERVYQMDGNSHKSFNHK